MISLEAWLDLRGAPAFDWDWVTEVAKLKLEGGMEHTTALELQRMVHSQLREEGEVVVTVQIEFKKAGE